jgi:hypothetical protein
MRIPQCFFVFKIVDRGWGRGGGAEGIAYIMDEGTLKTPIP